MIKKLRIKLILLTMISVIAVLAIIMTTINVSNYVKTTNDIDSIMNKLIEHGGSFDDFMPDDARIRTNDDANNPFRPGDMGRETPFETRFFVVTFSLTDDTTTVNVKNISIEEDEALSLAKSVLSKERGYKNYYRFRVLKDADKINIFFVDSETRLTQITTFLNLSLLISFISIVVVFIFIFLLSKKIIKPISDAYERQKRFITNAAHELKTPLTVISANNEMIELTNGESDLTLSINKQIVRMNNMVKNLSALSKIDEETNLKKTDFNLIETLDDMIESYSDSFNEKKKEIKKDYNEEIVYSGDEGLIRQLFSIILDNALKYSKTFLNVKAYKSGKKTIISFINDASKIEIGNLDKCFERFYRFDESRASMIEGSGIGLSIAKEIIELHKGDIHAIGHENNQFEIKIIL